MIQIFLSIFMVDEFSRKVPAIVCAQSTQVFKKSIFYFKFNYVNQFNRLIETVSGKLRILTIRIDNFTLRIILQISTLFRFVITPGVETVPCIASSFRKPF